MRGSLELSLNALVMFIISVMILGFGIWLVGVFVGAGAQIIQAPDYCKSELDRQTNVPFAICPTSISADAWVAGREYEIRYRITNTLTTETTFAVELDDGFDDYQLLSSAVYNISRGGAGQGITSIRFKPDNTFPGGIERVRLRACAVTDENDLTTDCTTRLISTRTLTINS
jgi:hypothetical protein